MIFYKMVKIDENRSTVFEQACLFQYIKFIWIFTCWIIYRHLFDVLNEDAFAVQN